MGFIWKELFDFLLSRFFFTSGMKMVPVFTGWYIYEKTESAFALGMLGLSEVIPALLLALPAGVKADTGKPRQIMLVSMLSYLAILAGLTWITMQEEYMSWMTLAIFGLIGCTGWIRAYLSPAYSSMLGNVVKQGELVKAASLSSLVWLMGAIAGPLSAGFLISFLGIQYALWVVFCVIFLAIVFVLRMQERLPKAQTSMRTWEGVREGFSFLRNQPALLGTMGLDMFAVLFGGAVALLPVFAKDILFVGPMQFGFLQAATYLGNFIAVLLLTWFPIRGQHGMILYRAVFGFGLCILVFAVSPWFWLSFIALFLSGLFDGVSVVIRGTIFQVLVPESMRGRVASVNSIFINSSNELGQFESGLAASLMGTIPSVIFGGIMTLVVTLVFYFKVPALKLLEYPNDDPTT